MTTTIVIVIMLSSLESSELVIEYMSMILSQAKKEQTTIICLTCGSFYCGKCGK
jgi:hypothetical protein